VKEKKLIGYVVSRKKTELVFLVKGGPGYQAQKLVHPSIKGDKFIGTKHREGMLVTHMIFMNGESANRAFQYVLLHPEAQGGIKKMDPYLVESIEMGIL